MSIILQYYAASPSFKSCMEFHGTEHSINTEPLTSPENMSDDDMSYVPLQAYF